MKKTASTAFIVLFIFCSNVYSQLYIPHALDNRVKDVMSLFSANPQNYDRYFSNIFLSQVPDSKLTEIFTYYHSKLGNCINAEPEVPVGNYSGKFNFIFKNNMSVPVNITVDKSQPHLIVGLWIGPPVSIAGSYKDVVNELKKLPGKSSLLIIKISGNKKDTLAEYNPGLELAIGSAFKLYVLSELLRTINNGKHKWSDVVHLKSGEFSLPSGFLQKWPDGSPVTLHTLASLMISQSDNTAADRLLYFLGRKNVEKILTVTGHSHPALDIPFLSTSEMFKLKGEHGMNAVHKYLSMNSDERREFLNSEVSKINIDSLTISPEPVYIDSIEWFASAADLCKVMDWIRLNSENKPGAEARKILSINPGLQVSKDRWKYVGYKGGSEAGVINMTYLLQSVNGGWYELSAGWNNAKAPLDESKFIGLVGGLIKILK